MGVLVSEPFTNQANMNSSSSSNSNKSICTSSTNGISSSSSSSKTDNTSTIEETKLVKRTRCRRHTATIDSDASCRHQQQHLSSTEGEEQEEESSSLLLPSTTSSSSSIASVTTRSCSSCCCRCSSRNQKKRNKMPLLLQHNRPTRGGARANKPWQITRIMNLVVTTTLFGLVCLTCTSNTTLFVRALYNNAAAANSGRFWQHLDTTNDYYSGCIYNTNLKKNDDQSLQNDNVAVGDDDNNNNNQYHHNVSTHGNWLRVCNSEDPQDAAERNICRVPPINQYMEIRIFAQPWESAIFEAWILQIILSELLDVPTTIETGSPYKHMNFYDKYNRFDHGPGNYVRSMIKAREVGDCRPLGVHNRKLFGPDGNNETSPAKDVDATAYQQCAHFVPEVSDELDQTVSHDYIYDGIFDAPKGMGSLGQEAWFIPKFTAQRDPSLVSWLGMIGGPMGNDENRHKLAARFKRPTTWKVYCDEISPTNCLGRINVANETFANATDANEDMDEVVMRPPKNELEGSRYFVRGLYKGHFRATEENDCEAHPKKCTGHIVDYPCTSLSYVYEQTQYLNISLESNGDSPGNGGYDHSSMEEIWRAANATQSDVIMTWWTPDVLFQEFQGTNAEFIKVNLPTPTEQCLDARIEVVDRCDAKYRTPATNLHRGECDTLTRPLLKMSTANLYDLIHNPDRIPEALQSPAFDVLDNFQFAEQELNEIFVSWNAMKHSMNGTINADPRKAVCDWVGEHLDYMNSFVPRTYPRVVHEETNRRRTLMHVAAGFAACVLLGVIFTGIKLYSHRNRRIMQLAQIDFLWLLLSGALMITVAALIMVTRLNDATCIIVHWIINIGYTLVLVPLIVKVAAVIKLASAAKKMRRLRLTREKLFRAVWCIFSLVVVFMILWTVLDPPRSAYEYKLKLHDRNENGDTIVSYRRICHGNSMAFQSVSVGWHMFMLVVASVLAVQMSKIESQELSESGTLAVLIYSHAVFVLIRMVTYFLGSSMAVKESLLIEMRSIVFSLDALSTILIYFMPKFLTREDDMTNTSGSMFFSSIEPFQTPSKSGFRFPGRSSKYNSNFVVGLKSSGEDSQSDDPPSGAVRRRASRPMSHEGSDDASQEASSWLASSRSPSGQNLDAKQRCRIIADLKRTMDDIQQEINVLENLNESNNDEEEDDDVETNNGVCKNSNTSTTHSETENPPSSKMPDPIKSPESTDEVSNESPDDDEDVKV